MGKSRANRRKSDPAKTRRNSHLHKMRHSPRRPGRMVGKSQAREHQKRIERKPPTSANRLRGSIPVPRPRPSNTDRESWKEMQRLIDQGLVRYGGLSNHPKNLIDRTLRVGPVTSTPKPIQPSTKENGTRDTPLLPGTRDGSSRMGNPSPKEF